MKECVTHHHACDCREAAMDELRDAARAYFDAYCVDEADDWFDEDGRAGENTGCTREQCAAANRLRDALNRLPPNNQDNRRA